MKAKGDLYLGGILRPLLYALSVFFIFYTLIIYQYQYPASVYFTLGFFGAIIIGLESFFTIHYVKRHTKFDYNVLSHSLNHSLYPLSFYTGFIIYSYFQDNYYLSFLLLIISFILYFVYYYYLARHLHYGHADSTHAKKASVQIDFILYFFKIFSYFALNLGLFDLFENGYIGDYSLFGLVTSVNFLYLISHLNRRLQATGINLVVALLFAIVSSVFIFMLKVPAVTFSASISAIIFYITSGIFYHKVDGTFNYRIFIEYISIATILSVFLFSA